MYNLRTTAVIYVENSPLSISHDHPKNYMYEPWRCRSHEVTGNIKGCNHVTYLEGCKYCQNAVIVFANTFVGGYDFAVSFVVL